MSSAIIIPIITEQSITEQWINQEIGFATAIDKKIMPIIESGLIDTLKGFIHKQIDLPYTYQRESVRRQEDRNFIDCFKKLFKDIEKNLGAIIKQGNQMIIPPSSLIDLASSREKVNQGKIKLNYYEHWSCTLRLKNENISAPVIYNRINKFYSTTTLGKQLFPILNNAFRRPSDSQTVTYWEQPHRLNAMTGDQWESMLQIMNNEIKYEFIYFSSDKLILTTLVPEIGSLLGLLLISSILHDDNPQIEVNINLLTNGDLIFHKNNALPIFAMESGIDTFQFDVNNPKISRMLKSIENKELLRLMEDITHRFVCKTPNEVFNQSPFLTINDDEQNKLLYIFKRQFGIDPATNQLFKKF
jgi:hypothetical protein